MTLSKAILSLILSVSAISYTASLPAAPLRAGAAKVDITRADAPTRPGDGLFARALVVKSDDTTLVLVTLDAVAIENIGYIKNDYLPKVRAALERDLKIQPQSVVVNASHCHGIVCPDVAERTVQVVKQAWKNLTPVKVGVGTGREDRVMENRRLKLKSGKEADVRHAYSLPPDDEVVGVGPVDTEIGVLRLDRMNGTTLAVVYNFAVHPIQGVAGGENTADLTGFASQVIEDNLSEGTIALFVQGCAGDINPALYKDVDKPRDAEPLGNMLGLSTLKAVRGIQTADAAPLKLIQESLTLPRGDRTERIFALEARQKELLGSLTGTSLNLKTFLALTAKYDLATEFPSHYAHRYAQEKALGREELRKLDANNRKNLEAYLKNVLVMEELTRVQENLRLLRLHQAQHVAAGKRTLDVELVGLRLGDFVLVTSPGELTCQIGLNIKKASPHKNTFVAGYTNGYIYYAPTAEQLANVGGAQEDSDCLLAPEWQKIFEDRVAELLKKL
jgi:hypothetical protein